MNSKLIQKLKDPEYRKAFVASQINIGIPFQIRALQKARGWTQEQLAEKAGMLQPRISAMRKPGQSKLNLETIRRLAEAFDCGLIVRFAPFSELVRWSDQFEPDTFNVPSHEADTGLIERKEVASVGTTATQVPRVAISDGTNGTFAVERQETKSLKPKISSSASNLLTFPLGTMTSTNTNA